MNHKPHKLKGVGERYKYLRYLWELNHPKAILKSPPPFVVIEPTTFCNLNCTYCARETMPRAKKHIDIDMFRAIVEKFRGLSKVLYLHHAGEPLLHPRIDELVRIGKKAGYYTLMNTNATLLNEKKSEMIISSGLDVIEFSIDSIRKETYESVRLNGKAPQVWRNAIRFLEIKRDMQSPIIVRIRMVKCEDNENVLEKEMALLNDLPFDEIRVSMYLNNKFWEDTETYFAGEPENPIFCTMPWKEITCTPDGVGACAVDFHTVYPWGDVSKESVMDVWNSPALIKLRKAFISGNLEELKRVNDICWRCNAKTKRNYNDSPGFIKDVANFGLRFPAYYFPYLRFVRTKQEESALEEKYKNLDVAIQAFEEYAGYKIKIRKEQYAEAM